MVQLLTPGVRVLRSDTFFIPAPPLARDYIRTRIMTTGTTANPALPYIPFVCLFATTSKGLIGRGGKLPWNCPEDLEHFKRVTSEPDTVMIMGRKTWDSLPIGKYSGEKLAGRKKIILTHKKDMLPQKDTIFTHLSTKKDLLKLIRPLGFKKAFVIGGGQIINSFIPICDEAIITFIKDVSLPDSVNIGDASWYPRDVTHYMYEHVEKATEISPHATVRYYVQRREVT